MWNLRRQKYLNSRNVCKVSLKFTIFELQKKFHTSVSCTINFVKNEQGQWPSVSKMGIPSFLWTRSLKNLWSQFISGYQLTNQRPFPLRELQLYLIRELQLYLIIFLCSILQVSAHWRRHAETCRYNCCTVTVVSRPALYRICTVQKSFTTLDNIPL